MPTPDKVLHVALPVETLLQNIDELERVIVQQLSQYEASSALAAWFDAYRAIEELINLPPAIDDDPDLVRRILDLPVLDLHLALQKIIPVRDGLSRKFGPEFTQRFIQLITQGAAIALSFKASGLAEFASEFQTAGMMIGYLQSRRRHFVALSHLIPVACRGSAPVAKLDALNVFLPIIDMRGLQITGAHNALIIKKSSARLGLSADQVDLHMLDDLFLEPERARIIDMPLTDAGVEMLKSLQPLPTDQIFSAAELRNQVLHIEAAYAEFDLSNTEFSEAAALVRLLSKQAADDYFIAVSAVDLDAILAKAKTSKTVASTFVSTAQTYMQCLDVFAPFVWSNGRFYSTVTLLTRFLYHWRAKCLERGRRFQIRAGFIFEDAVAGELSAQGFDVKDITRINHREFDVVTMRDNVIWNVQCKNNFTDLEKIVANPDSFARFNRRLVKLYAKALVKEKDREDLLKAKLQCDAVQHVVVSRFPVICDHARIIPFSRISNFSDIAASLLREYRTNDGGAAV